MCSVVGCDAEQVVLVDVEFPEDAAPVEGGPGYGRQRLGYCVAHAAELSLAGPLVRAVAVRGRGRMRFPDEHAAADAWSWKVV